MELHLFDVGYPEVDHWFRNENHALLEEVQVASLGSETAFDVGSSLSRLEVSSRHNKINLDDTTQQLSDNLLQLTSVLGF